MPRRTGAPGDPAPRAGALRAFRYPALWVAGGCALVAVVVIGSLMPAQQLPQPAFPGVDKLEHFIGYAALAGYGVMLFERARAHALAATGALLLGVAIEFAQEAMTDSRIASPADMLANSLGVLAGWALHMTRLRSLLQAIDTRLAIRNARSGRG